MYKTSKDILTKSLERRVKHGMVQVLEKFDSNFPALANSDTGKLFKFDIKNMLNDIMRANRDEIRDYEIEYAPVKINLDNTLTVTRDFMNGIQAITFGEMPQPSMRIITQRDVKFYRLLESIRRELGVGIVYKDESDCYIYNVTGLDNCINYVIPFMDLYQLHSSVRSEYLHWRKNICTLYTSDTSVK